MTTWIISDTHFGDGSLIGSGLAQGKTARGFETVSEMNECLADNWNTCIGPNDEVLHLGDVCIGDGCDMLARLNGKKHLLLGNHDNPLCPALARTFTTISLWKAMDDAGIVLTHLPIDLSLRSGLGARFITNIHGHLHNKPAPTAQHLCVSVEQTGYAPLNFEEVIADILHRREK